MRFSIELGRRRSVFALGLVAVLTAGHVAAGTVATGGYHSLVVTDTGTVFAFGYNPYGQLGLGQTGGTHTTPSQVTALSGVMAVAAGANHSLALKSDGTVWAFGLGTSGQLGQGSNSTSSAPVQVVGLTGIVAIAAGDNHSLALKGDGSLYTWGVGTLGQLCDGGVGNRNAPYLVTGLQPVAAIGAGGNHSLIVLSSVAGSVMKACGKNTNGQLGTGSTSSGATSNPASVNLLSGMASASGGSNYSLAVKQDSTAYGWGYNGYYQLGDNTNTQRLEPVPLYGGFSGVATLVAGQFNSFAIKADGSLWAMGDNSYGQQATGNTTASHVPTAVPGFPSVAAVGAGPNRHTIIVTTNGEVWGVGYNAHGELGDGTTSNQPTPVKIAEAGFDWRVGTPTFGTAPGLKYTPITLALNCATSGAIIKYTTDGTDPSPTDGTTYTVAFDVTESTTVKAMAFKSGLADSAVASGAYEMKVYLPTFNPGPTTYTSPVSVAIGTTSPGAQLYYTLDGSDPTPTTGTPYVASVPIATTTTLKARGFRAGWTDSDLKSGTYTMNFGTLTAPVASQPSGTYTSSVEIELTAQAWAEIRYTTNGTTPVATSALYTGPLTISTATTLKAKAFHPDYVASAVTTESYTIQLSTPGFDRAAGSWPAGTLVTLSGPPAPAEIHYTLTGADPTASDPVIAAGETLVLGNYTLKAKAIKADCLDSAVAAASYLVTGTFTTPAVAAGYSHSLLLLPDGTVWATGLATSGQIGDGSTAGNRPQPVRVAGLTGVVAISAGAYHSLALDDRGRVWGWGLNSSGQLGDGSTLNRSIPTLAATLSGIMAVAAGGYHSLFLDDQGRVWAAGSAAYGQIGDGFTTNRPSPVLLVAPTAVTSIAAGLYHSLASDAQGHAWSWGLGTSGQLGLGSAGPPQLTPAQIPGLAGVTAVAAGCSHSLALVAGGGLYVFGLNSAGQLGLGPVGNQNAPVAVTGITGAVAVRGGEFHSLVLLGDGTLLSFGSNAGSQLGAPGVTTRNTPGPVPGLGGAVEIGSGRNSGLALTGQGETWVWGTNDSGKLGDGTTLTRPAPVKVTEAGFQWKAATPTFLPAGSAFQAPTPITVSSINPGAEIHYTTTGVEPTVADPVVASGGTVVAEQSLALVAKAWLVGVAPGNSDSKTVTLTLPALSISPGTGNYSAPVDVSLGSSISGVTIHYTTDNSTPAEASPSVPPSGV